MASKQIESLDTSVLLRVILEDNKDMCDAALDLLDCPGVVYKVADLVLMEIVFVLENMEVDRETIAGVLIRIITRPNIETEQVIDFESLYAYVNHPKLSFVDCYLATKAAYDKAEPLWTFDRKLVNQVPTAKAVA